MKFEAIFGGSRWGDKGVLEAKIIKRLGVFGDTLVVGMANSIKDLWGGGMKEDSAVGDGGIVFCRAKWSIGGRRGLGSGYRGGEEFKGDMRLEVQSLRVT